MSDDGGRYENYMEGEVDPEQWEECKAPCELEDKWKGKWRVSPNGQAYHLSAERYFPGRGTWHQEVIVSAEFLRKARHPGTSVTGLLYSLVPETKQSGTGRIHLA